MEDRTTSRAHLPAQRNAEGRLFLAETLRAFHSTGAIAPSSRWLATALTDVLREQPGRPLDVLEVGAGTGPVTRALIPLLDARSRLDIVEANPRFAARLRQLVCTHPALNEATNRARVHETFIEHMDTGRSYDVIVSGLPFANFDPGQVATIMNRYVELLRPGGTLAYFSYAGTARARKVLASRSEAARHRAVEAVLAGYQRRYAVGCWPVWANLPPARVWQLRKGHQPATPHTDPDEVRATW